MQKYVHIQGLRSMAPFPGGMLNRELYSILFSLRGSDGMHTEFKSKERYSCRIVNNTAETAEAKTAVVPPVGGDVRKVLRPGPTGHHPGILPASGEKSTDTIMWIETFTAAGAPPLKAAENPPEKKGETAIWV